LYEEMNLMGSEVCRIPKNALLVYAYWKVSTKSLSSYPFVVPHLSLGLKFVVHVTCILVTFLWRWNIQRHTSRMGAQLTLQMSFMCNLPCGYLWRNIVLGSVPCGGISPVELVCDLVSSHLASCNLRTESMASSVHNTGGRLFFCRNVSTFSRHSGLLK
jgi:hypothetical protein